MGHTRHHAMIVTSNFDGMEEIHAKAVEIFGARQDGLGRDFSRLVTPLQPGVVNRYQSFAILPDGSKEFWEDSIVPDQLREEFKAWLKSLPEPMGYADWVEVCFPGDDRKAWIVEERNGGPYEPNWEEVLP